jgi:iron complex transport system permease protein
MPQRSKPTAEKQASHKPLRLVDIILPIDQCKGVTGFPASRDTRWIWPTLGFGLLAAIWINLSAGSLHLSPVQILAILTEPIFPQPSFGAHSPGEASIIWNLRLPRVLCAIMAGAALAAAGAATQGLFRNPLADPALIGVTSGGALGALAGIIGFGFLPLLPSWLSRFAVPGGALVGAICVTLLVYQLATRQGRTSVTTLLLVGIAVNALAGALIGLALYGLASAEDLRSFIFWTLGSLERISWSELGIGIALILPAACALPFYARPLNLLLLGEAEAFHLGIPVDRTTRRIITLCAALAGTTVALVGTIGFVGLIVPHLARRFIGPDHRKLLPASALGGATLLLIADAIARTIVSPGVLPIGVLTALAGAPFFLYILWQTRTYDD